MCGPRSYSPEVATAQSASASEAASRSRSYGCRMPTRQRPRSTMSPPASIRKRPRPKAAARCKGWNAPPYKNTRGTLYKYIKNVKSASEGCVTDE